MERQHLTATRAGNPNRSIQSVKRFVQLIRYHHASQIGWRLWRRGQSFMERYGIGGHVDSVSGFSLQLSQREVLQKLAHRRIAAYPHRKPSEILEWLQSGEFRFLNATHCLETSSHEGAQSWNWLVPNAPRLWRFHLHCHEFLVPLVEGGNREALSQFLKRWLFASGNDLDLRSHGKDAVSKRSHTERDADAWHPFCISRRLPVWLMLAAHDVVSDDIQLRFWESIGAQIDWLIRHIEYDLGGNHLLENYRALVLAKECLVWPEDFGSSKVLRDLESIVVAEIGNQVLPWGEHFERTPTYHAQMALAVREVADVWSQTNRVSADSITLANHTANNMAAFVLNICHPDGQIPLLGDSALDETPAPQSLFNGVTESTKLLPQDAMATTAGPYWVWRSVADDFLIVDTGDLACDHLPAHGHADLFGIEASVAGERLFVDAGTFDYEETLMRQYCRGSHSHNVAVINGCDHADVWSRFRMGRRGRPLYRENSQQGQWQYVWAIHDAYRYLGIAQTHRLVLCAPGPVWICLDWLGSPGNYPLESRLHLNSISPISPAATIGEDPCGRHCFSFARTTDSRRHSTTWQVSQLGPGSMALEPGWYCPEFGKRVETTVVSLQSNPESSTGSPWIGWVFSRESNDLAIDFGVSRDGWTMKIAGNSDLDRLTLERQLDGVRKRKEPNVLWEDPLGSVSLSGFD